MDGMIAMLPAPLLRYSTHHDFPGQKIARRTYRVILTFAGIIGCFIGYWTQQLSYAIITIIAASAFTALIILPPWPFLFRKNPIVWQSQIEEKESSSSTKSSKKGDKKKKWSKKTTKTK